MKKFLFALLLGASFSLMSFTDSAPDWIVGQDGYVIDDGDYCCVTFITSDGDVSYHGDCAS